MAEDTMTPEDAAKRKAREKSAASVEQKEYKLAPGDYSGNIGGTEGTIHVPESGEYKTKDAGEQGFLENVVAATGRVVKASANKKEA